MAIFDILKVMFHHFTVDNVYNSAYLFVLCATTKRKFCVGVLLEKLFMIFIPLLYKSRIKMDYQISVHVTVKAAML